MTTPKITFVGAGSVVFTQGLLADLFTYSELDGVHVALHDIDPERLATALAAARQIAAARGVKPCSPRTPTAGKPWRTRTSS